MRVLVIEDEPKIARAIKEGLEAERYQVEVAATGEDGFFSLASESFDIVLLDLMLPGRDGLEVLRNIRKRTVSLPVLVITARDSIEDRVIGLDNGADDYLVKPFAFAELLARVRALLRRGKREATVELRAGDLELDLISRSVRRAGRPIELTTRELELLELLLRYRDQPVSREMIGREVWKETSRATPLDNVIDVHIARLRKKIDQDFEVKLIETVRGVGFRIRENPS